MKPLTSKEVLCRMAEYDLACNLDKGAEYTGFKKLYTDLGVPKGHISQFGYVYDISKLWAAKRIISFLEQTKKEKDPKITMASGSFFSMNKLLQGIVGNYLRKMAKVMPVMLYVGKDVRDLFTNTGVQVKIFDRIKHFIPHFIVTNERFELALPHTEKKLVRVDINSSNFDRDTVQRIIKYFDSLALLAGVNPSTRPKL